MWIIFWNFAPKSKYQRVIRIITGDIDCYHVLYKDTLEEYLFHDLKFETASASRHEFANITADDKGNQYFTLNLQLRFIQ